MVPNEQAWHTEGLLADSGDRPVHHHIRGGHIHVPNQRGFFSGTCQRKQL